MKPETPRALLVSILVAALLAVLPGCRATGDGARQDAEEVGAFDEFGGEFDEFDEFGESEAESEEVFDPLSGYNRVMFAFNDKLYVWVWDPVARGYRWAVPEPARVAVGRMFRNLLTPTRLVNSLLQLELGKAGTELGRLVVNTTLGIGGLFDPADAWFGWEAPSAEDFGQTLGSYGVGPGFPIVLPFLGPSNLRDGLSLIPDGYLYPPVYYFSTVENVAIWAGSELNRTSLHIGEYESLKQDALDPYTFFRDAYQQYREEKIEE